MFYGEYFHSIDRKGRLILPAKFREAAKSHFIEKFLNKQCSGDSTVVRPREKIVVDGDIWGEASI